jgi:hypothetical protein
MLLIVSQSILLYGENAEEELSLVNYIVSSLLRKTEETFSKIPNNGLLPLNYYNRIQKTETVFSFLNSYMKHLECT